MNMFKWLLRCVILVVCITGTLCASMPPYLADNAIDTDAVLQHLSEDSAGLTPTEKVFDPAWVASLNERGKPTVFGKVAFELFGLRVGGLCAGKLYLGVEGQICFWYISLQ